MPRATRVVVPSAQPDDSQGKDTHKGYAPRDGRQVGAHFMARTRPKPTR